MEMNYSVFLLAILLNLLLSPSIVPTVRLISIDIAKTLLAVHTHRGRRPIGSNVKAILTYSGDGILYVRSATMKK